MTATSIRRPSIPLRWKIPILVVTPLITAVGLTGWLTFRNGQNAVENLAQQLSSNVSREINLNVQGYLDRPVLINHVNAAAIRSGNLNIENFQELERYFWNQIRQGAIVNSIFFGNEQGDFISVNQEDGKLISKVRDKSTASQRKTYRLNSEGKRTDVLETIKFDPRTRPWYEAGKLARQPTWSRIYPFASRQVPGITAATPIVDNTGKLRGVLGIDLSLKQINDFLSKLEVSKSGEAFILNRAGNLVGSSVPNSRFIGSNNELIVATDTSQPVIIKSAIQHLLNEYGRLDQINGTQPMSSFKLDGKTQLVNVSLLEKGRSVNWLVVVVIPEEDFIQNFHESARFNLLLGLVITGVAVVLGLIAAQRISQPISTLTDAAEAIQLETFDPKSLEAVAKRDDELGQLGRCFQQMASEVYERHQRLKQHVQELDDEIGKFKKEHQLAGTNEKYYFLELLQKAKDLRRK